MTRLPIGRVGPISNNNILSEGRDVQKNTGAGHALITVRLPTGANLTPSIPAQMIDEVKTRKHLGGIRATVCVSTRASVTL